MKGFISPRLHPLKSIFLFLVYMFAGICIGNLLGILLVKAFFGYGLLQIGEVMASPKEYPGSAQALVLFQAITHLFGFTAAALAFLKFNAQNTGAFLSPRPFVPLGLLLASAVLFLLIMPANSFLIEWNMNIRFPAFLAGFEQWAKAKEEELRRLTEALTVMDSLPQFLLAFVAIGVIPAIGEELVFRGYLQQELRRWWKNPHLAIWVTAFVFGAIHLQFYGFFPRMLLGVLFGYLYLWSKNIWVPIVGHLMNNGFQVLMLYLAQHKMVEVDVDSAEAFPWYSALISLLISAAVLYTLRQSFLRQSVPAHEA